MRLAAPCLLLFLAAPLAHADDAPLVEELFLTEAPWAQGRGDLQLTGAFLKAGDERAVAGVVEYGVTDRVQIQVDFDRTLPEVGDADSEIEIGGLWAVRPDLDRGALSLGVSLAQLHEDASLTFVASVGHTAGDRGVLVADVVVPLAEEADPALHAGYVHRLGSLRLLAEAELALGRGNDASLAPGIAWKPSEPIELGAALVLPVGGNHAERGVIAQATIEF